MSDLTNLTDRSIQPIVRKTLPESLNKATSSNVSRGRMKERQDELTADHRVDDHSQGGSRARQFPRAARFSLRLD